MNISLSPFAPENVVSRDGIGRPLPRQPARLHPQAEWHHRECVNQPSTEESVSRRFIFFFFLVFFGLSVVFFSMILRLFFLCAQEIIPKYFDGSDVGVVSGGVEQTTALLAEK